MRGSWKAVEAAEKDLEATTGSVEVQKPRPRARGWRSSTLSSALKICSDNNRSDMNVHVDNLHSLTMCSALFSMPRLTFPKLAVSLDCLANLRGRQGLIEGNFSNYTEALVNFVVTTGWNSYETNLMCVKVGEHHTRNAFCLLCFERWLVRSRSVKEEYLFGWLESDSTFCMHSPPQLETRWGYMLFQ